MARTLAAFGTATRLKSDESYALDLTLSLDGPLAATLQRHAARRNRRPVDLLRDLIEVALRDDMIDAVLDDTAGPT